VVLRDDERALDVRDDADDERGLDVREDFLDERGCARVAAVVDVRRLVVRGARRVGAAAPGMRAVTLPIWASNLRRRSSRPTAILASALSLLMSLVIRLRSLTFCFRSLFTALSTGPCPFLRPGFAICHLHRMMSCLASMMAQRSSVS
jgi:hypothetical protein